jgi:hypothetical protein
MELLVQLDHCFARRTERSRRVNQLLEPLGQRCSLYPTVYTSVYTYLSFRCGSQ